MKVFFTHAQDQCGIITRYLVKRWEKSKVAAIDINTYEQLFYAMKLYVHWRTPPNYINANRSYNAAKNEFLSLPILIAYTEIIIYNYCKA